jgi:hypothetical protein
VIRATSDAEVRALIDALDENPPVRRESAIARLSILGSRAVGRLVSSYESTTDRTRQLAILRVLQTTADERALPVARRGLHEGGDLAVAAVALLRALLEQGSGATHAGALDLLLAVSSDERRERRIRAAAVDALTSAPDDIREAIGHRFDGVGSEGDVVWDDAAEGRLPEEPAALMEALDGRAERAPLPVVLRIIQALRAREGTAGTANREWQAVRGALHQVAAARRSRIALYDLRETIEAARTPLPASFLSAVQEIGEMPRCAGRSRSHPDYRVRGTPTTLLVRKLNRTSRTRPRPSTPRRTGRRRPSPVRCRTEYSAGSPEYPP